MDQVWSDKVKAGNIQETIKSAMNQINKGAFEEITELDEEQNYSSGFNSGRSKEEANFEQKYSQIKDSIVYEETEKDQSDKFDSGKEQLPVISSRGHSLSDNTFDEDIKEQGNRESVEAALKQGFNIHRNNNNFGCSDSEGSNNSSNRSIRKLNIPGIKNDPEYIGVKDSSGIDQLKIEMFNDTDRKSSNEENRIERRSSNQELTNTPLMDQSTNNLSRPIYSIF